MNVFLPLMCVAMCCVGALACETKVYRWHRQLKDRTISEMAIIDSVEETVLMSSIDSRLDTSGFFPAVSLHDFKATSKSKQGLVAIKVDYKEGSVCYVKDVARGYTDTVSQLNKRHPWDVIRVSEPETKFNAPKKLSEGELRKNSIALDTFCTGSDIYVITPATDTINPKWRLQTLLCIWFPIPIFTPFLYTIVF